MPVNLGILGKDLYLIDIDLKDPYERKLHYGNLYKKVVFEEINLKNNNEINLKNNNEINLKNNNEIHIINGTKLQFKKVNDNIFRIGGMSIGFKNNDYCQLIHYEHVSTKDNSCSGNHCIIDAEGQIVFEADSPFKCPYYHKGCIMNYNDYYINIKTGKPIVSGYHSIESENYLFVKSGSYKNEFPKGVYKIDYCTGEFEIIN